MGIEGEQLAYKIQPADVDFCVLPGIIENVDEIDQKKCVVHGTIPSWLRGEILRNGPGRFTAGEESYTHWFDGHAMLTKFSIKGDGNVYFKSKFINTEILYDHMKHKSLIHGGIGTKCVQDPCYSVFKKFFTQFWYEAKKDNTNVNVIQLGDSTYATSDVASTWKFDKETLQSEKKFHLSQKFTIPTATAHPHTDINGDYLNIGNTVGKEAGYAILRIPRDKMNLPDPFTELEIIAQVPAANVWKPSYHHSFSITENYIIIMEQSMKFDIWYILKPFSWQNSVDNKFTVDEEFEFKFHVVCRKTKEVIPIKYCTKPNMFFHQINAYEEKSADGRNNIILDICMADEPYSMWDTIKFSNIQGIENNEKGMLHMKQYPQRFVLPLQVDEDTETGKNLVNIPNVTATAKLREDGYLYLTSHSIISESIYELVHGAIDMPRINSKYVAVKYRYAYYTGSNAFVPSMLIKVNHDTGEYVIWKQKDEYASEPVFIPRPDATEEDDGVVLSTVCCSDPNLSAYLLILDAKTFTEVARAEVNAGVNYGFHANFIPDSKF